MKPFKCCFLKFHKEECPIFMQDKLLLIIVCLIVTELRMVVVYIWMDLTQ